MGSHFRRGGRRRQTVTSERAEGILRLLRQRLALLLQGTRGTNWIDNHRITKLHRRRAPQAEVLRRWTAASGSDHRARESSRRGDVSGREAEGEP